MVNFKEKKCRIWIFLSNGSMEDIQATFEASRLMKNIQQIENQYSGSALVSMRIRVQESDDQKFLPYISQI
jgi:hypothetical protein